MSSSKPSTEELVSDAIFAVQNTYVTAELMKAITEKEKIAAQKAIESQKLEVESKKLQFELEASYTPEQKRLLFIAREQEKEVHRMNQLQTQLLQWSDDRCSYFTPHQIADDNQSKILNHVQQYSLENYVLKDHKQHCYTSRQNENIYDWMKRTRNEYLGKPNQSPPSQTGWFKNSSMGKWLKNKLE